ncbi:MAG: tetratricopeptide repeat protein, partial [Candidatus Heimdallarchaeota archaeon]|nr:tetratricopeptide repeat protein [Candidatus Heimdallarchaeota archaeon]
MISHDIQKINSEIEAGNYEGAISLTNALDEQTLDQKVLKTLFLSDIHIFQGDFERVKRDFENVKLDINEIDNEYLKIYFADVFSGFFIREGDLDTSRLLLTQQYDLVNTLAMEWPKLPNENIYPIWIARYFHTAGNLFLKLGKLDDAKKNYGKSIKIKQEIKDRKGIASSLNKLSIIGKFQGRLLESIEMSEESILIDEQLGNVQAMATTLMTLAVINRELKQEKLALENLEKSLFYLQKEKNPYLLALVNHEMFITLVENNRELSNKFFEEIQKIMSENAGNEGIRMIHDLTRAVYLKTSKRGKDKYQSQELLIDIVNRKLVDYRITIYAIVNLMELQLEEFQSYGEEEVFLEIVDWIERMKLIAITHDSLLLIGELNLIDAKFELLKGNITKASENFDSALTFARFNGLEKLVD